jgi:hypothetical protein
MRSCSVAYYATIENGQFSKPGTSQGNQSVLTLFAIEGSFNSGVLPLSSMSAYDD